MTYNALDWKSNKPRMHVYSEEDPPPDAPSFCGDVVCEHGAVSPSPSHRKKIGRTVQLIHPSSKFVGNTHERRQAKEILLSVFPSWQPPSTATETCAVCEAQASISKEGKKDLRKKAEEEKVCGLLPPLFWKALLLIHRIVQSKLKFMNSITYAFFSGTSPPLCAVIPSTFYRAWKRWVDSPTSHPRPTGVDNSHFLCESHSLLLYDPNCSEEIESTITIIRRDEWDELVLLWAFFASTTPSCLTLPLPCYRYPASPLIALHKNDDGVYKPDVPICSECRTKR